MTLRASSVAELSSALAKACSASTRIEGADLRALNKLLEYRPEDMTVTVQTGITLAELQKQLASSGQWLPIDPPHPESLTIDELLNRNFSGPRRFGYGTIREHLLGITAVLADGRVIHNGGKVVKNVAGFDLCKLFVGSQWSLGIGIEATFKVRPLPALERFLAARFHDLSKAGAALQAVIESQLTPAVLDLYSEKPSGCSLVLGLAGTTEEVDWQLEEANKLGLADTGSLDYERAFWALSDTPHQASVLPSGLIAELQLRKPDAFVARAGNGIIFYRGGTPAEKASIPVALNRRLKQTFDPKNILPELAL
ncbi:MAG TPA: FAD-binding oxidoreductase [Verrucomicrobiae bacterium]|nr:FAD-binding oxidoreductase [Verrucomicrobiae bacterium]